MLKQFLVLVGMTACVNASAFAQPVLSGPDDIVVPEGYRLVEIPAEFETTNRPTNLVSSYSAIVAPPVYRHTVVNGERRRENVYPPRRGERILMGPVRIEKVRVIMFPKSYALQDKNGRTIGQYRWVEGKLTLVDQNE